jgi:hypothetical protein
MPGSFLASTGGSVLESAEDPECPAVDPSDAKFIAVANAHPDKPPIVQGTDSKWIGWRIYLERVGIQVDFIDEPYLRGVYAQKMGGDV